jgi:excisionase family DNA binding protein
MTTLKKVRGRKLGKKVLEPIAYSPLPVLLSAEEAAELLGVSKASVVRYIKDGHRKAGKLPATRLGKAGHVLQERSVLSFKARLKTTEK